MKNSKVISISARNRKKKFEEKNRIVKNLDGVKYFSKSEIRQIRRYARNESDLAKTKGNITAIKNWMIIDLLTSSGCRSFECANLKIGDLKITRGKSEIFFRGKAGICGTTIIPISLKRHLRQFLKFKESIGEGIKPDEFLFKGQRGPISAQGIQLVVKKILKKLNLWEKGVSAHSLRHSYAVQLYAKEKDLRAVQKSLRHVSVQSTIIYADVTKEEIAEQVKGLWN